MATRRVSQTLLPTVSEVLCAFATKLARLPPQWSGGNGIAAVPNAVYGLRLKSSGEYACALSLLSVMIVAGLLIVPEPHEAAAAPVMPAATRIIPAMAAMAGRSIAKIYYYHGHYYPSYYHGGYYPYRYGGQYYRHRHYRYGRWHYY